LRAHLKRIKHGGILQFFCEEDGCGAGFPTVATLPQHYLNHTPSEHYSCNV
jgi:hypothetical protein